MLIGKLVICTKCGKYFPYVRKFEWLFCKPICPECRNLKRSKHFKQRQQE